MSDVRKEVEIDKTKKITLKWLDQPFRGTVFFNGPVIIVRRGKETAAARKLYKLAELIETRLLRRYRGDLKQAARAAVQTMVESADGSCKFWTGEGFGEETKEKLLREAAAIVIEYYNEG